jgi:hypothetical protein
MELLFKLVIKTGSKIIIALRDRMNPFKTKKIETDPDVPNELYASGIEYPLQYK